MTEFVTLDVAVFGTKLRTTRARREARRRRMQWRRNLHRQRVERWVVRRLPATHVAVDDVVFGWYLSENDGVRWRTLKVAALPRHPDIPDGFRAPDLRPLRFASHG